MFYLNKQDYIIKGDGAEFKSEENEAEMKRLLPIRRERTENEKRIEILLAI